MDNRNRGFTLTELMIVVAIIAILAAIAVPSMGKYIKKARTSEATANLAAIQAYEEAYFSENDQYVTCAQNPTTLPTRGDREQFSFTPAGWSALGRVMPDGREVYFQYQVTAGTISSSTPSPATVTHGPASGCGTNIGLTGFSAINPITGLGVPNTNNTFWFIATAIGDQNGDGNCSLFIAVTDRPDITAENAIE